LVDAAKKNGIECFVWSTLPSSVAISNGKYRSQIYENKYKVDHYMKENDVPGPYFYTGNFFENSVLRGHVKIGPNGDLEFRQPVILEDTKCIT
jgi:NmrA-like family